MVLGLPYGIAKQCANAHFIPQTTDFQAFTADTFLRLNLLKPTICSSLYIQQQRKAQDWQEIEKVMHIYSDKTAGIDNVLQPRGSRSSRRCPPSAATARKTAAA